MRVLACVLVGVLVLGAILLFRPGGPEEDAPVRPAGGPPPEERPAEGERPDSPPPDSGLVTLRGLVLRDDGRPAGAGVVVRGRPTGTEVDPVATVTEGRGFFAFGVGAPEGSDGYRMEAEDPETGACGRAWAALPPAFSLIVLRPACVVTGRVVDGPRRPVPGARVRLAIAALLRRETFAWRMGGSSSLVRTAVAGADGRFRIRVRSGPSGRIAAVDGSGVLGPIVDFEPRDGGVADVGDLPLAHNRTVTWFLRFTGPGGAPVPDAEVVLEPGLGWHGRVHPRHDLGAEGEIGADDDGVVELTLPRRTMPATALVRSPTHFGGLMLLDLRRDGPNEAVVHLRKMPALRILITGGEEILPTIEDVRTHAVAPPSRPHPLTAWDVASKRHVPIPEEARDWGQFAHSPSRERSAERLSEDLLEIRGAAGQYRIHLRSRTGSWTLGTAYIEPSTETKTIEMPFPAGRFVEVRTGKLRAWAAKADAVNWVTPFCVWPEIVGEDLSGSFAPAPGPTSLLGPGAADSARIWIPAGFDALVFGYPEDPVLQTDLGLDEAAPVPIPATGPVEAPVPTPILRHSAAVRIRVHHDGKPFRHPGVEVRIYRKSGEAASLLTDADGEVTVRLFEGTHHATIDGIARRSTLVGDWPRIDVSPPFESMDRVLEFELPR